MGSFDARILARLIPRQIISLTALCLVLRPALLLHDKPCVPLYSTVLPQGHSCASQSLVPSLSPVATMIVAFVIRRRTAVIGKARSQSPACGAVAARSLAFSRERLALSSSSVEFFFVTALSHSFCLRRSSILGMSVPESFLHEFVAMSSALSGTPWNLAGMMSFWICSVLVAESQKSRTCQHSNTADTKTFIFWLEDWPVSTGIHWGRWWWRQWGISSEVCQRWQIVDSHCS